MRPQVPVHEVQIYSKKMLHELLTRKGFCLPKLSSAFITIEQLLLIRDGKIWSLKQNQLIYRECTRPPSIRVLADKLNAYCHQLNFHTGINPKCDNYPDKEWLIKAIATLSRGNDEIFALDYVPSASDMRRVDHKDILMVHNNDGLLDVPASLLPKKKGRVLKMVTLTPADKIKAKIMMAEQ